MCLGIVGALAGAAVSAVGSIAAGNAQNAAAKSQAKYLERQAKATREKSAFDQGRLRRKADRLLGRQIAGFAKAGVGIEGSPTDVIDDSLTESNLDVAAVDYSGKVNASNLETQADLTRQRGKDAKLGGIIGALKPIAGVIGSGNFGFGGNTTILGQSPFQRRGNWVGAT